MFAFINLLRALAVTLITNSHFDGVYPIDISWGGCPGVALFFTITGYLLVPSVKNNSFCKWYFRKFIRLYIPLTIVNIIYVLSRYKVASVSMFLFPLNSNWYVPAIAILYIVYYVVLKYIPNYKKIVVGIVIMIYAISYTFFDPAIFFVEPVIWFRYLYGIVAMILGAEIRKIHENKSFVYGNTKKRRGILASGVSICCIICFLGMKLLMSKISILMYLQFLTQVFSLGFAYFGVHAGFIFEEQISVFMKTFVGKIVNQISNCSLEIYLIQFIIIHNLKAISFPLNFISIVVLIVFGGKIFNNISNLIIKFIEKKLLK